MKDQKGFTLFSLVITLTLSGILIFLSGGIMQIAAKSYTQYISRSVMLREAQNTIIFMQNNMPLIIPENIIRAKTNHFWFITANNDEIEIEYKNKSGILQYRISGQHNWKIILNNIQKKSFTFDYFESDGSKNPATDEIGQVHVSFSLQIKNQEMNYESQFYIRN